MREHEESHPQFASSHPEKSSFAGKYVRIWKCFVTAGEAELSRMRMSSKESLHVFQMFLLV